MIKHYCDFCEKEAQEKDLNKIILIGRRKIIGAEEAKDICQECTEKIWKQKIEEVAPVQQEEPQKEKAPEEPKQPKRKMIDRGKVIALHLAGWSGRKIAEEMKCSEQSISNIISQERRKVQNEDV